jgi:succinyl-diaminopimelate desuccinylase
MNPRSGSTPAAGVSGLLVVTQRIVPRLRAMPSLADRLAERTLELVNIPSESRREAELAGYVEAALDWEPAWRSGETLWYDAGLGDRPLVVLAGHLDTVPSQGNLPGRLDDGAVVGLGASDMKGGVAIMVELARAWADLRTTPEHDLAFLFFPREELDASESALPEFFDSVARVHDAALAILLEPTDVTIQAGCLGNLNALVHFHGVSGHSARPWTAENAIDKALEGLRPFAAIEPRPVELGGLTFTEVVSLTQIEGGIATNVIPDRVTANVNFRFAPDRSPSSAEAYLRALLPDGASFELLGYAPPGRVVTDSPLVQRLRAAGELAVEPKQAWTNVADFTSRGIDAVNFGPGATRYAHRRDEQIEIAALERTYTALWGFLTGTV